MTVGSSTQDYHPQSRQNNGPRVCFVQDILLPIRFCGEGWSGGQGVGGTLNRNSHTKLNP